MKSNNNTNLPATPNGHMETTRTPRPSDWQHVKILMHRNLTKDLKKPALWAAKTLLAPVLFMLYTIGFFVGGREYSNDGVVNVGDYRLFQGEKWTFPTTIWIGGWSLEYIDLVRESVETFMTEQEAFMNVTTTTTLSNLTEFTTACQDEMPSTAAEGVCVYFNSTNVYSIYYGGQEMAAPFQPALAAAQYVMNEAIVDVAGGNPSYPVDWIQRTPRLLNESTVDIPVALLLVPAILYVLSVTIELQFIIGPVVYEKINHVRDAYELVGVNLQTYLLQWNTYFGLNSLITAGAMTAISIYWKIFPLSSPTLIFFSHLLGLLYLNSLFIIYMQVQVQEEAAQGKPWIVGILSMAIGSVLLVFAEPTSTIFYVLSAVLPGVSIMQYFGIYITYDAAGYDTGIHLRNNVISSGLLGSYFAQLFGLAFYLTLTSLYSSQRLNDWLTNNHKAEGMQDVTIEDEQDDSSDRFEPLVPGSEVVISVRGLEQTYMPARFSCNRAQEPVRVLKGLDLDVCRGEVFGYLGHNGAGKTTSINIMTGEMKMQHGSIQYHFRDGTRSLQNPNDRHTIRTNIGVCPQHNTALQNDMTAREFLRLIAYLKGGIDVSPGQSPTDAVEAEVQRRLTEISFTSAEDADKLIDTYSGGMKRKVLIAMALIGNPDLVFLDEPTAGLDPYNRRAIWDVIIAAKKQCSILLCSHFMDEVDVLSDRIGILKDGKLMTCGSSLFLKHHFGAGYTLKFNADHSIDVTSVVPSSKAVSSENNRECIWSLGHGSEDQIPTLLEKLVSEGGRDVELDLTTLEDVFLETGKEDSNIGAGTEMKTSSSDLEDAESKNDPENPETQNDLLAKVWEPRAAKHQVGFWSKLRIVSHFMMTDALNSKGAVFLNIAMPMIYLIAGVVLATVAEAPKAGELIVELPIMLGAYLSGKEPLKFFGVSEVDANDSSIIDPLVLLESVPESLDDYFSSIPVIGGYFSENSTLQYAPDVSPFALQIGVGLLSNYTLWQLGTGSSLSGIVTAVQQLPYLSTVPFRIDLLFIPYCLVFGFAGLAFSVLDVLLLKGNKTVDLFRVAGITEWTTYLGVMAYKFITAFLPFFVLLLVLGFALGVAFFGNGGRWLGTILICLSYAFSSSPQGLILAKRFIKSDFESVSNWFPGVYFTVAGLPYILYSVLLQTLPDAEQQILILGDVLSIVPQVAFQRAIGAVIGISTEYNDPELDWGDVWAFQTRIWYCVLMMTLVGAVEWWYLFQLTTTREHQTKLEGENSELASPVSVEDDQLIASERQRSMVDDQGINTRDLVKVFEINEGKKKKTKKFKCAVKGLSLGIRKGEIFVLLGPNGAGKTVTMSALASAITPEHGEIVLDGTVVNQSDRNSDKLYKSGNISYCAQFDALFTNKTVIQHFEFFSNIRGLDWHNKLTQDHVGTIMTLLSLEKHQNKTAEELSGGYKRRLCLGLSMVGYPSCCALDEPTTGLDPGARHLVWDVLKPENIAVPAILMCTHYMEEAAALGTRIGIMVDGEFISTGSLNELYERYCTSFFVEISFKTDSNDSELEGSVVQEFEAGGMSASVYESLPYHIKLQVDITDSTREKGTLQLAAIFMLLESKKTKLHIKFYSVAKMNLEQIFINLSRKQFEANEAIELT